jgi:hypothetical protein
VYALRHLMGERGNAEHGIDTARTRKQASVSNKGVPQTVYLTEAVNGGVGCATNPTCAHLMPGAVDRVVHAVAGAVGAVDPLVERLAASPGNRWVLAGANALGACRLEDVRGREQARSHVVLVIARQRVMNYWSAEAVDAHAAGRAIA